MDEKEEEKQRQEMHGQQFLKIIEAITTKGQDEDKGRKKIRIAEARERDERMSEKWRIFAERLHIAHNVPMGGHLGSKKTLDRFLSRFYWPGIIHDENQHCKSYEACQKSGG